MQEKKGDRSGVDRGYRQPLSVDLTEDQIDTYAISGIAGLPWLHGQFDSMGEDTPGLGSLVRTAFPPGKDGDRIARLVIQRMVGYIKNPAKLEARRHELFGTTYKEK